MESMFQLLQREGVVVYLSIVGSKLDFFLLLLFFMFEEGFTTVLV